MAQECLFCRIARGEIPATILYQDDALVAFRDIQPEAPTHILIIPKTHIPDVLGLTQVDGELLGRIFTLAAELARQAGIADGGFRLVVNTGADAGQTVSHLHVHLLGGRQLGWPPG